MTPSVQSQGGTARAAKLSPERRTEISRAAANARWAKPPMSKPEHTIKTAGELIALIPHDWNNAEVGIANGIGAADAILRVSLHENADGRRIVLIHKEQIDVQ